ncbi:MAG: sugar ABC transporter substrate-binding protein [Spirochaetes bacterium]|nr:sugar ABC transporter substrate-binding protein [Spirochaetota bacterium]
MMKRLNLSKKLTILVIGIVLCVILLFSIAGKGTGREEVALNVLSVQDPFYFGMELLISEFEEETGIKVNLEGLSYDALHAKIITSFVGKTGGVDVVTVDQMWLSQYADNNWITDLTPYIENDKAEVKMNEFVPEVIYSMNEWRGKIFTMPIAAYGQFVLYRTDLMKKAGLKPPPEKPEDWWTWEKYYEYVKELDKLGPDIYGTVICGAQPVPIVHMYTQLAVANGVTWVKNFPEGTWDFTPTINTPDNVKALEFYKALYQHSPPECINYNWFDAGMEFAKKDISMFFWWTPYGSLVRQAGYMVEEPSPVRGKYKISPLPRQPGKKQIYSLGGWSVGIPTYSAAKDEAWEFVKWVTGGEAQKEMGLAGLQQFNDFCREPLFHDKDLLKVYPWLETQLFTLEEGNGKIARPPFHIYTTLEGFYGLQLNMAVAGIKTPEEALKEVQSQFELALKQNFFLPYVGESYDDTLANTEKLIKELSP